MSMKQHPRFNSVKFETVPDTGACEFKYEDGEMCRGRVTPPKPDMANESVLAAMDFANQRLWDSFPQG